MNILTFDIEEWFHILDHSSTKSEKNWLNREYRLERNTDRILTSLDKKSIKASFFCLGWVAKKYPNVIKKISDCGHSIGSHSDMHQLVYSQSKTKFELDLEMSIKYIEDIICKKIRMYRAPGFSITSDVSWAFDILRKNGIDIDCSIFVETRSHGGYSNFPNKIPSIIQTNYGEIKEFPVVPFSIFGKGIIYSGGGYFRLIPYPLIKYMANQNEYVMTYFHPRDFDFEQPIIEDLSYVRKFKSYYGLKGAFDKYNKFINDYDFIDILNAENRIDWSLAPRIQL